MSNIWCTPPPPVKNEKPGQLTESQINKFYEDGFLLVDNFFDSLLLEGAKKAIEEDVEQIAKNLYDAGKIKSLYNKHDLFHRMMYLEQDFPGAGILIHKAQTMKKELQDVFADDKLLNMMEQFLGPNLAGHAIWNIRPKSPKVSNHDVPWHQDSAYTEPSADKQFVISAWIPLLDANANNGCLEFIRGAHKAGKLAPHKGCYENTWYLWSDDKDMATLGCDPVKDRVCVEAPYGSLLIFNNLTPHRSLVNTSDHIRWTLDFRWQADGQPNGFAKPNITLRRGDNPNLVPDWDKFNGVDRHALVQSVDDTFDTVINPQLWAQRWPLEHSNKHTQKWKPLKAA